MHQRTETRACKILQIFWARLASFGHLGLISDPLIVPMFQSLTLDKPLRRVRRMHSSEVASSISAQSLIFYGHSPPSADSKRVGCQLQAKVCTKSTG